MNRKSLLIFNMALCLLMAVVTSCGNDDEPNDMTRPEITEGENPSPVNCEQFERGGILPVRYILSDDKELGSYNIEIHNNFDHHSHSTSGGDCPLDPVKEPVNPWVYNQDGKIPEGSKAYNLDIEIPIPDNIDTGDYHFMIRLTDQSGWQVFKAVSVKIV